MRTRSLLVAALLAPALLSAQSFDATILSYEGLDRTCDGGITPVLRIQNTGGETMMSCDIDILRNGLADNTFHWVLAVPALTGEVRKPALPTITGPLCRPMRISRAGLPARRRSVRRCAMWSRMSSAASTMSAAEDAFGSGNPAAAMYASPMVLIFSTRCRSTMASSPLKRASISSTSSAALSCSLSWVKPLKSVKSTVALV